MTTKYFLDPVCGYGNTVEVYINNRLPEIIDEFESREAAVHYICENEVYMFNYKNLQDSIEAKYILKKYGVNAAHVYHINWDENNVEDYFEKIMSTLVENNFKNIINGMPKFDYIIQNPPYKRGLHLDFFETALQMLSLTGKMVIIEPSTWLINLRKNGKAKRYDLLKNRIEGHVKSVNIENLNLIFNINIYMPLSITTIDMSKTYDTIDFTCCGEHKTVQSIYDCNLIGNYNIVQSIINKCTVYDDMMKDHVYDEKLNIDTTKYKYIKIHEILGGNGSQLCGILDVQRRNITYNNLSKDFLLMTYNKDTNFKQHKYGEYFRTYLHALMCAYESVLDNVPEKRDRGNHIISGSVADCLYGSESEMKNYEHYVYNNKLPLFISLCMTIDQNNNVKSFIPWLVDKQYTDEEIYNLLGITEDEQKLINNTLEKFKRNSKFFNRYICGECYEKICD